MQLFFIDESGTPPKPGQADPRYFVIGGIAIPDTTWHRVRDGLMGIKIRRRLRGELKWRYFAPGNNDPRNPLRNLAHVERDAVRAELYDLIVAERSIRIIASICSCTAVYRARPETSQTDIYHLTFKTTTERFQYYLQDLSRTVGRPEYGIVVSDQRGSDDDKRLRYHHERLLNTSAEFVSKYTNLVESLFLQPSNLSVGIQLADIVAGAIWRKFERNDDRWYRMIEPAIRRGPGGAVDGYGIVRVPKRGWE